MANKLILKKSSVAAKVPLASDLVAGELAVNLADAKLYTKDAGGNVILVGSGAAASGVSSVTGTAPIVSSGGSTPAISISAATTSAAGSMSASDKSKLDGIAAGAQVNTVTSVAGKTGAVTLAVGDVSGAQPSSTAITTSNIGSQSVNYAATAAAANSLNQYQTFPTANGQDFNSLLVGGNYNIVWGNYSGTLNTPPGSNSYGNLQVISGANFTTQSYYSHGANSSPCIRIYYNGSWSGWIVALTSANYNSYSPSLTGGGASGTWGINVTGNAATATLATKASTLSQNGGSGAAMTFNWSGQGGQPSWLWGSNDGANIYVYNPSNFSVNYATTAGSVANGVYTNANATFSSNVHHTYGPNSSWGAYLRVGGNGRTVSGSLYASVVATDGNLHIDAGDAKATYINYYAGTSGINFGNGASGVMGTMTAAGNLTMNGNVAAYSDERLKKNWRSVQNDFVQKLAKVKSGIYERTDMKATQAGVSAQSLQKLLPETVNEGADGTLSVAYGNAAMVAAVELAKVVEELRAEIAELKLKIKD